MVQCFFKASAAGSLMLMGEYAVLTGYPAIVASINKRIHVKLTPREDDIIEIYSDLGNFKTRTSRLKIIKPFDYVLATLMVKNMRQGVTIDIQSEFSSKQGLGSSAAVTVALLMALSQWEGKSAIDRKEFHEKALESVRRVQGKASGADIAASLVGGAISYSINPLMIHCFDSVPDVSVVFSGSKTTTTEALKNIKLQENPSIQWLGELSRQATTAMHNHNFKQLADFMCQAQQVMKSMRLSTPSIDAIVSALTDAGVRGAKISGSGLGDCVIGLGKLESLPNFELLPITLAKQGANFVN